MQSIARHKTIAEVERWLGASLPPEYVAFICTHEEGLIGERVLLYAAESIIECNETYETKVYCPGYLTIGDDSGGRAVVISANGPFGQVYLVDHGYMCTDGFELLPLGFTNWVAVQCPVE